MCGKEKHFYLNLENGKWDCKRCGEAGGLWKLADAVGIRVRERTVVRSAHSVMVAGVKKLDPSKLRRKTKSIVPLETVDERCEMLFSDHDHGQRVHSYLTERGISEAAIRHFKLGVAYLGKSKELGVGIPFISDGRVQLVKMRNLATTKSERKFMRTKGGESALFNQAGVKDRKRVVLVEGELDAISLWQSGITEVASTSIGAKASVPQEWKEALFYAEDIVLWYDDDSAGDEAVAGLATALGSHRVRIASIPDGLVDEVKAKTGKEPKDVNDLVKAGVDRVAIQRIVADAKSVDTASISSPSAYVDEIHGLIEMGEASLGEPTGSDQLDKLLRGWRPGELTLVTGHTRHGKSTWMSFMLELLARRDVPVLMSSMEDGPRALFRKIFQRRFGLPISSIRTQEDRQRAYDVLESIDRWPVYIMDHFGRTPFQAIRDDMLFAVHRLGIKYLMLDHLGFIAKDGRTLDEREHLDNVLMDLREMAEELGIHIFLIAHPRGSVDEQSIPDGTSIKGTSGAKQIAHNGISVFRCVDPLGDAVKGKTKLKTADGRRLEVELQQNGVLVLVWKARHDEAQEGHAVMEFDSRCLKYKDTTASQNKTKWSEPQGAFEESDDPFDGLDF